MNECNFLYFFFAEHTVYNIEVYYYVVYSCIVYVMYKYICVYIYIYEKTTHQIDNITFRRSTLINYNI